MRDIPYMPGHRHISTYIYSHIQECRCAYIHTTDTHAGAYEYPLRLPAGNEGDSRQLKEWATRESGVKCNFDTREFGLVLSGSYSQGARIDARTFDSSRLHLFFITIRKTKEEKRETKSLFYCILDRDH